MWLEKGSITLYTRGSASTVVCLLVGEQKGEQNQRMPDLNSKPLFEQMRVGHSDPCSVPTTLRNQDSDLDIDMIKLGYKM